jgi:hypothetical protein
MALILRHVPRIGLFRREVPIRLEPRATIRINSIPDWENAP